MSRPADDDARARGALLAALMERREALGLTVAHVAARMQVAHGTVAGMERGETDPRLSVLQQYARAVGLMVTVGLRAGPELAAEMCGDGEPLWAAAAQAAADGRKGPLPRLPQVRPESVWEAGT